MRASSQVWVRVVLIPIFSPKSHDSDLDYAAVDVKWLARAVIFRQLSAVTPMLNTYSFSRVKT
jgi:hypothetical protein